MRKYFFYRSGISGGTATLSLRIAKALLNEGYQVFYIYKNLNDKNNYTSFLSMGVVMLTEENVKDNAGADDEITVLTYTVEEHAAACRLFQGIKNKTVFLFPVTNSYSGVGFYSVKPLCAMDRGFVKPYLNYLCENKLIFFAGEGVYERYKKYFDLGDYKGEFYPLPMQIPPFDEKRRRDQFNKTPRRIVTVLRSEFPLKGYVFGLIDEFIEFSKTNDDAMLFIIASGEKTKKIKDKLDGTENIQLLEGCSYEQLQDEMRESYVNVGHGTSVLDGAVNSTPTIVALEYSYSKNAPGLYSDYKSIVGREDVEVKPYGELLKRIFSLNEEEYVGLCRREWEFAKSRYSMDSFIEKLHSCESEVKGTQVPKAKYRRILLKTRLDGIVRKVFSKLDRK